MALRTVTGPDAAAPLDLLCVAPHPDDAELGMGGTLILEVLRGRRVGILDLTMGEMATNGTPEQRLRESVEASAVLGLFWRGNLGLADRGLQGPDAVRALAGAIRLLRPAVLCLPHPDDPHPDHSAAQRLTVEATFSAGLRRYPAADWAADAVAFRPATVLQYFINGWQPPAFVVDVTPVYDRKRAAILAHHSQFDPSAAAQAGAPTRLNTGAALSQVEARDRYFGAGAGVAYAESFVPVRPVRLPDFGGLGEAGQA